MRTDTQKETPITNGVAEMDINDMPNGEDTAQDSTGCNSGCENADCGREVGPGCQFPSMPAHFAMFGPCGPRGGRRGRKFGWGPPPGFGHFPHGPPPPPPQMDGAGPFGPHGPPHMGMPEGCPPWMTVMPENMDPHSRNYGPPAGIMGNCYGPPGFQGFPFYGMRRGMGRGMKWKRWARKMAGMEGCPRGRCNKARKCQEEKSQNNKETKCQTEQNADSSNSGSDDETTQNDCVNEFEDSLGAPPMTHLMMMQMHHLRMAKHHRMMAQNFAKRNQCIMKQRCRTMRKCGITKEHIKAWRQKVKEWKKANKPCCEGNNEEDKIDTESEEEAETDEVMA